MKNNIRDFIHYLLQYVNDEKVKKLIIKELKKGLYSLKLDKVKYWYDEMSEIHFVEIYPKTIFDNNAFIEWELYMIDLVDKKSKSQQTIYFLKENDDIIRANKYDFEKEK